MTIQSKTTLKTYFETGDTLTQASFIDLIDSLASLPPATAMTDISWVARIRATDIAGSDGASITSFTSIDSNARTFSGTATLKTASNGINSKNVLRFNGTSNAFTTAAGAASLASDWYMAAVVKFVNVSSHRDILSWGDASNGERRSMHTSPSGAYGFIGESADAVSTTIMTNGTARLLEMAYDASEDLVYLWVNGVEVYRSAPTNTLAAYASTVLRIGSNPSGAEFLSGDLAEAFFLGSFPSSFTRRSIYSYIVSEYALSIPTFSGYYPYVSSSTADLTYGLLYESDGSVVVGSSVPLNTGGTNLPIDQPATFSIYGTLAAYVVDAEHLLSSTWGDQNVLSLWNKNSIGWSAIVFRNVGTTGEEMAAVGMGAANRFPWTGPNQSLYIEASNFKDTSKYGDFRVVQTSPGAGGAKLRHRMRDDTNAFEDYSMSATAPSVNGPTADLVSLRGKPTASVANDGTLDTNITTGAGQCGLVVVKDATGSKCAVYRLENATLTSVSADASFSTTIDTASKINVYNNSGQIRLQNKTGGALSLTAAYYGA
jgi:hypothetical protein